MTPQQEKFEAEVAALFVNHSDTICRELCEGVPGARVSHPRLLNDILNAAFCVARSRKFRDLVAAVSSAPAVIKLASSVAAPTNGADLWSEKMRERYGSLGPGEWRATLAYAAHFENEIGAHGALARGLLALIDVCHSVRADS